MLRRKVTNVRNLLLKTARLSKLKKTNDGILYKQIEGVSYGYEKYKKLFSWMQDVLMNNRDAASHQNIMDRVKKDLLQNDYEELSLLHFNNDYIGFKDGVFNLVECEFTKKEEVEKDLVCRKYFDMNFEEANEKKSVYFDKIFTDQFEDEGVINFTKMMIGRSCFEVGRFDKWECMLSIVGKAATGKSVIINLVVAMNEKRVGAISDGFEKKFGLSQIANENAVVADELPADIERSVPAKKLTELIRGDIIQMPVKYHQDLIEKWKVPMIFAAMDFPQYKSSIVANYIIITEFAKEVQQINCTLKKMVENELPIIMINCCKMYKEYREKFKDVNVWKFCPYYFVEMRHKFLLAMGFEYATEGCIIEKKIVREKEVE
ncbi:hypothetical protein HK099_007064 [Clydaea vesicula]|uniref:NrS-1 polymerase-like helicase domain-containing protein n=1 Tax=Clydaea vesicula TaxID=447962 RepID=A0AAD5U1Q4_9FUNG|nr:hypothetical protein HK099_007064 [Clydaea vesicula]